MRLDDLTSSPSSAMDDPNNPTPLNLGLGLWGAFYISYWITTSLFVALVYLPPLGMHGLLSVALWIVALGVVAIITCQSRIAIHDMLTSLNERERLAVGVIIAAIFLMPAVVRGPRVLQDGFLWAAPLMLLLSVNPVAARRLLAWTLAGAWFAAWEVQGSGGLVLLLAFALSWLVALGLTHFTFTGEPHGLTGWWSVKRVVLNALLTAIPATMTGAVAWLMWLIWKSPAGSGPGMPPSPDHPRLADRMDTLELMELIWWGAATIGLTVLLFIMLYHLRKFFLKRRRGSWNADVLPGQLTRMDYHPAPKPASAPAMAGLRGRIIAYWGRWATAMEREGLGRAKGETAAQYAERLARDAPEAAPPAGMIELLERVHYGPDEPVKADLEAMRQFVQDESSRLSLTRQKPMDPADSPD